MRKQTGIMSSANAMTPMFGIRVTPSVPRAQDASPARPITKAACTGDVKRVKSTPDQFRVQTQQEIEQWKLFIKEAGKA